MSAFRKNSLVFLFVAVLLFTWAASPAFAAGEQWTKQEVSGVAMGFDLVVLRPLGLVATVGGVALFIVSLPFSALGGNTDEAAEKLVKAPFNYTFSRPLGHEVR